MNNSGIRQSCYTWQHFSFQQLKTGSASGRHMRYFVFSTPFSSTSGCITTTWKKSMKTNLQVTLTSQLPIMVIVPLWVAATTSSIIALVPLANFSHSNTPAGLRFYDIKSNLSLISAYRFNLPIPHNHLSSFDGFSKQLNSFLTNIQTHPTIWNTTFDRSAARLLVKTISVF